MGRVGRCLVLVAWWAFGGCAPPAASATLAQLRNRAALDLNCNASQLSIQRVDSQTQTVTGCGKRFTYVEACTTRAYPYSVDCTWLSNGGRDLEATESTSSPLADAGAATDVEVAELEVRTDAQGEKELRLHLAAQGWDAFVRAQPKADAQVATLVVRAADAPDCQIKLVSDGARMQLSGVTEKTGATDDYTQYRTGLPYDSLVAMARGTRVLGRVCDTEFVLTSAHIAKLVEMVMRIREELAWDESPSPAQPPKGGTTEL